MDFVILKVGKKTNINLVFCVACLMPERERERERDATLILSHPGPTSLGERASNDREEAD